MLQSVTRTFNLRPGEGRIALLLLLLSFLTGGAVVFTDIASSALFLSIFSIDKLALVYIAASFITPLVGLSFTRLQRRFSFSQVLVGFTAALFLSAVAIRAGLWLTNDAPWLVFSLLVWFRLLYMLAALIFWGLAGRMLNLRQGKRLFGLISTGESIARTIGYFSVSLLVAGIGVANLLLISAVSLGIAMVVIGQIGRLPSLQTGSVAPRSNPVPLRGRYIYLIWFVSAFAAAVYLLVDVAFAAQARQRTPSANELAALLGLFYGVLNACRLIARPLSSQLITRYGLAVALLALPVAGVISGGIILVAGAGGLAFWAGLLARFADGVLRSAILRPATQVLYQPLQADQRITGQTVAESVVEPLTMGLTGGLLLLIGQFNELTIGAILLAVCLTWVAATVALNRDYLASLRFALARRAVLGTALELDDPASVSEVLHALASPRPSEVVYAIELLAQARPQALAAAAPDLLSHVEPTVRQSILQAIARLGLAVDRITVRQALDRERDPATRADAARALCAVAEDEAIDTIAPLLNDPQPLVRMAAMSGLLRYGGVAGTMAAGPYLLAQASAPDGDARVAAARVLALVAAPTFARNLAPLLTDPELTVRRAALHAAGQIGSPRLWPAVLAGLRDPATYRAAVSALASAGQSALAAIEQALADETDPIQTARIVQVYGRIGGPAAIELLRSMLPLADPDLRGAVVAALDRCGYQAIGPERAAVQRLIDDEGRRAAWLLTARADLGLPANAPLVRALDLELARGRERLTHLLTFVYDREAMSIARHSLGQATTERRAFALELIDTQVERGLRSTVIALLDDLSPSLRLQQLQPRFSQASMAPNARLRQIIEASPLPLSPWTGRCARYILDADSPEALSAVERSLIERTMLLRQVGIFDAMADDLLVDVAARLNEQRFFAGELIVQQGAAGDCMYLIVEGHVRVYDGAMTINTLGPGNVLGELALLDPAPRLASASAVDGALLFRLDRERFAELLEEHPAIARGLLSVLARRLRSSMRDLSTARAQLAAAEQQVEEGHAELRG